MGSHGALKLPYQEVYPMATYTRLVGYKHCGDDNAHPEHGWRVYRGVLLVEDWTCSGTAGLCCCPRKGCEVHA